MAFKHLVAAAMLTAAPSALAWGDLGHQTVAYIAQNFVAESTRTWAEDILGIKNSSYLASVATWADDYRYTSEGSYSAPYHFIDANDSPPSSCNVDYERDCGATGCSISALLNYTTRVQDQSLGAEQQDMALKWIIHFVGDSHQPLHDEAIDIGGNEIYVTFDGDDTNLHHTWDTNMPEKYVGGYELSDAERWASELTTQIKSGNYSSQAAGWIANDDISDPVSSTMGWASEANAYVCSVVMPNGASSYSNQELDGDYYESAIPTIELQIAKAGYRLANWLDQLAANAGSSSSDSSSDDSSDNSDWKKRETKGTFPDPLKPLNKIQMARRALKGGCGHDH